MAALTLLCGLGSVYYRHIRNVDIAACQPLDTPRISGGVKNGSYVGS